jgi:galactitol-specific phosphotransferase system IIB component
MREGGNACGGGISESTSMKEHLSVFLKSSRANAGVKKLKTTVNALLWAEY